MKNKDNVKEKDKMHNKRKINHKERGITLVALVITIIILLILAGVTINTALSENGLFRMAKKAVNEYQDAERQEQSALDSITEEMEKISIDYNDYVGAYVTGYTPKTGQCTIGTNTSGHDQAQVFTTDQDMKWRIWDYDKYTKTIRLISSKPTDAKLTLKGATGYNNGVWAVNEICRECYGSDKKGITVANLRRTDIQKVSTYDYTKYKHKNGGNQWHEETEETQGAIHFGESKTYNGSYPVMWEQYDSKWDYEYDHGTGTGSDKECEMWEREYGYTDQNGIKKGETSFKQSFYVHNYKDKKKEFIKEEYYNLLFCKEGVESPLNGWYYLAGRRVFLDDYAAAFGLQRVSSADTYAYVGRGLDI